MVTAATQFQSTNRFLNAARNIESWNTFSCLTPPTDAWRPDPNRVELDANRNGSRLRVGNFDDAHTSEQPRRRLPIPTRCPDATRFRYGGEGVDHTGKIGFGIYWQSQGRYGREGECLFDIFSWIS